VSVTSFFTDHGLPLLFAAVAIESFAPRRTRSDCAQRMGRAPRTARAPARRGVDRPLRRTRRLLRPLRLRAARDDRMGRRPGRNVRRACARTRGRDWVWLAATVSVAVRAEVALSRLRAVVLSLPRAIETTSDSFLFVRPYYKFGGERANCRAFACRWPRDWATDSESSPDSATQNACLQALRKTGATGLEPATSGVTGCGSRTGRKRCSRHRITRRPSKCPSQRRKHRERPSRRARGAAPQPRFSSGFSTTRLRGRRGRAVTLNLAGSRALALEQHGMLIPPGVIRVFDGRAMFESDSTGG
jgi:hypothetical protein